MGYVRMVIAGNIYGGVVGTDRFASRGDDRTAAGEWVHVVVAYERTTIKAVLVYINGILSSYTPRPARWSAARAQGAGLLYVGGSDHVNFRGRIAWIRAFDNDVFPPDPAKFMMAFRPRLEPVESEQTTGVQGGVLIPNGTFYADFLANYRLPALTSMVPDLSVAGSRAPVPPRITATHPGVAQSSVHPTNEPRPVFLRDPWRLLARVPPPLPIPSISPQPRLEWPQLAGASPASNISA